MSAGARLKAKLDLGFPAMRAATERVWQSPRVRELYPVYLTTLHGIVRSANPLIEAARDRAAEPRAGRRRCRGPRRVLRPPRARREGPTSGCSRISKRSAATPGTPEPASSRRGSASFVGAQYYWLRHQHPVSLLGHMAFVEGYPPAVGFSERLREATGYPREAFRAIRRHERLDIRHREELFETIDGLPLEPWHETLMGVSALHTMRAAIDVFGEIYAALPAPVSQARVAR